MDPPDFSHDVLCDGCAPFHFVSQMKAPFANVLYTTAGMRDQSLCQFAILQSRLRNFIDCYRSQESSLDLQIDKLWLRFEMNRLSETV